MAMPLKHSEKFAILNYLNFRFKEQKVVKVEIVNQIKGK
jgi:hypothetical protein